MPSPIPTVARLISSARGRRGSIIILVVALLVLMALIGTAALSTNTIDRYATQQHTNNTEIDLLVEGVKNMAKAVLVSDVHDISVSPPAFRPLESPTSTYDHWDMPLLINPLSHPPGMDPELAAQLLTSN